MCWISPIIDAEVVVDQEITAMAEIAEALKPLQPEEVKRVLRWASEKFLPKDQRGFGQEYSVGAHTDAGATVAVPHPNTFTGIADLFDSAAPDTGLEKILVAAYWFQVVQAMEDFDSQSLNTELKHLGHPSANITRDMDSLMNRVPKLILQTRKEGTARQARKKFKLTREGMRVVERLLSGVHTKQE